MRIESLESRLLLHAGHDHAPAAPPSAPPPAVAAAAVLPAAAPTDPAAAGQPMLPDMFPLVSVEDDYVHGWSFDVATLPGRVLLRLTTAVANGGRGPMELNGGNVLADGTQQVYQRINLEGGGTTSRLAGTFIYHAEHEHIHFDNFAAYRLRNLTGTGASPGVGAVAAAGDKVSFCLLDSDHFDAALPGSPSFGRYLSCGQTQGISVGWADVYTQDLPDQWIDVTDVPDGRYWLEVVADPDNRLLESDESNNVERIVIDLDKPTPHPVVVAHDPVGQYPAAAAAVDFVFSRPMDRASFSVSQDVVSFTGPTGADLRGQITGFSWPDDRTLRVAFARQPALGAYAMTIGPNVLGAGNAAPMDQDGDEVPGEASDRYAATFTVDDRLGPDAFGYEARAVPLENVDLARGGAGVTTLLDDHDDAAAAVPLGGNTFNFYGVTYGGNGSLYVSSNGLIVFGSTTAAYANADLTHDPTQPAIAVLWDDLLANVTAADSVLAKFEDKTGDGTADRLVIEWSDVRRHADPGAAASVTMTFQAILSLNTGAAPGAIVFNYRDIDTGSHYANGADATVGIKAGGDQTSAGRRLLVSRDRGNHPFVATGRAVQIAARGAVVGRHVFYNRSNFDGGAAAADAQDDAAVARDKVPYRSAASSAAAPPVFANVSTYSRGINGVMVDLSGLFGRTPRAADFEVRAGRGPNAAAWPLAPAPAVTVRRGAGAGGSDRVTLVWPDHALRNTWVRVTVKPTGNTNLAAADVFYFGHLAGEAGDGRPPGGPAITAADVALTRAAANGARVSLSSRYDHNRDGRVNALDVLVTRAAVRTALPWLSGVTPAGASAPAAPAPEPVAATRERLRHRASLLLDDAAASATGSALAG